VSLLFRRVEIAAVHADLRDGVFERAVQRQVAHRHAAPGYLQVGDPERRCDVPGGVRSRCPILCRVVRCTAFGYSPGCLSSCRAARVFHQRREIVAFGRHFEQRRDPGGIDSVETKTHRPHVTLGELHAQRIYAHHGPLLAVAQGETRQRGRTFGAQRQQVLGIAPQPYVGRKPSVHRCDVERLPEVGQRPGQCEVLQADADVEFRRCDVVPHVGRERTSLCEVQDGAHVGLLAREIDARDVQVDVLHAPRGIEQQVFVKHLPVADRDVVDAYFPRLRRLFGRCGRRDRVAREMCQDVVETERVAPLVDLYAGRRERELLDDHAVGQQGPQPHAHVETVEPEKGRRVVRPADAQVADAQAPREYVELQPFHADRAA